MRRGHGAAVLFLAQCLAWPASADPAAPGPFPPPTRATPAPIAPVAPKPEPQPAVPAPSPITPPAPETTAATPTTPAEDSDDAAPPAADASAATAVDPAVDQQATSAPTISAPDQVSPEPAPAEKATAAPQAAAEVSPPATTAPTDAVAAPVAAQVAAQVAAKKLFGTTKTPAPLAARAIGAYSRGCLSGAKPLAVDGPAWQAMRLSRNRTWGHPDLIGLLEKFAGEVKQDGWPGLLVGDISQPRGGPMLTGHASHQVGLDADIWFTPMPDRRLTNKERETLAATSMLAGDNLSVDPKIWDERRVKIIKRVASYPKIERVLVHPAIKKALCQAAGPTDRAWLNKVRPYWGHFYHFHIRIGCPSGSPHCKPQAPVPGDDGCSKELDDWFKLLTRKPKPQPKPKEEIAKKPAKPKIVTLDDLPAECRTVLATQNDIKIPPPATAVAAKPDHKAKHAAPVKASADALPAKPAAAKPADTKSPAKAAAASAAAAKSVEKTKKP